MWALDRHRRRYRPFHASLHDTTWSATTRPSLHSWSPLRSRCQAAPGVVRPFGRSHATSSRFARPRPHARETSSHQRPGLKPDLVLKASTPSRFVAGGPTATTRTEARDAVTDDPPPLTSATALNPPAHKLFYSLPRGS